VLTATTHSHTPHAPHPAPHTHRGLRASLAAGCGARPALGCALVGRAAVGRRQKDRSTEHRSTKQRSVGTQWTAARLRTACGCGCGRRAIWAMSTASCWLMKFTPRALFLAARSSWRRCCGRWLQGFKRPQDIEEQARLVAANACRGMRPSPTIRTQLIYSLFTSHIRVPVA
jgi:hypothetical protein